MKNFRRILPYLILNVIISVTTTLLVLTVWNRIPAERSQNIPANATLQPASTASSGLQPLQTLPATDQAVIQVDTVIAPGDLENEVVVLKRIGEGEISLTGWKLTGGRKEYIFPDLTLFPNGSIRIYTRSGDRTAIELFWNLDQPVWKSGDTLHLLDWQGNERAAYTIP